MMPAVKIIALVQRITVRTVGIRRATAMPSRASLSREARSTGRSSPVGPSKRSVASRAAEMANVTPLAASSGLGPMNISATAAMPGPTV